MLTDTHAHLASDALEADLDDLIARAAAAGVHRMVAVGCDLDSSRRSLELAERYPQVLATVGLHPTYVTDELPADWVDQLQELARHPRCAGIGETGLDFYHPAPEGWEWEDYLARQRECFAAQLVLAASAGLNVVVHQRDRSGTACWQAIKDMMAPWHGRLRAVFHCWLHSWEEAAPLVEAGHLISFTGIATYRNAPEVARCAARAPEGTFMLETDSPYLAPVPWRGKRNEPAFVRETAAAVAASRAMTPGALAESTSRVAAGFFHHRPVPWGPVLIPDGRAG